MKAIVNFALFVGVCVFCWMVGWMMGDLAVRLGNR